MALIYKPRYKYYNITFFALRFSSCWYKRWNHFWVYFQSCCRTKKSFDSPQQRTMCCDCPQRNRREEGNRETAFLLRCLVQPAAAAWYCFCFWGKLKKYLCHRCASLNTDSPGGGERERERERSDDPPGYNLRGGLTALVRTGLYTSQRKLFICFIRCCCP